MAGKDKTACRKLIRGEKGQEALGMFLLPFPLNEKLSWFFSFNAHSKEMKATCSQQLVTKHFCHND